MGWPIVIFALIGAVTASVPSTVAQAPRHAVLRQPKDTTPAFENIGTSLGVLVVDHYGEQDTVRILNDDGSLWYKFTFYYNDSDGKWDYPNPAFRPRAFNPDDFVLALDVVEATGKDFSVVVNIETGLRKRVKQARFLRFLSWERYILTMFAVGFDRATNSIRARPDSSARTIPFTKGAEYMPDSVKGEWLRVKWGEPGAEKRGWVRWRSGPRLLIYMYPSA